MKIISGYIYLILAAFILPSCVKCPDEDEDSNYIEEPVYFANVLFINAIEGHELIDIKSRYVSDSIENIGFGNKKDYIKIGSGSNNFKACPDNSDEVLWNRPVNLGKNSKYTFMIYGEFPLIEGFLINDTIENYNSNNVYIRAANLSNEEYLLNISGSTVYQSEDYIGSGEYTGFRPTFSGNDIIYITDNNADTVYVFPEQNFTAGNLYTIVIKGTAKESEALILTSKYWPKSKIWGLSKKFHQSE